MGKNPAAGMVFGLAAIGFAVFSMATRSETPPPGYAFLDYGLIIAGVAGIIGSLMAYAKRNDGEEGHG
jgi:hypothetical protein